MACLNECKNCCPLHEVDETCNESVLSNNNDNCSQNCSINEKVIGNKNTSYLIEIFYYYYLDCTKTIELCDITRKPKLKVCNQLKTELLLMNISI